MWALAVATLMMGSAPATADSPVEHPRPGLRLVLALSGGVGVAQQAVAFGPGIHFEFGAVFENRFAIGLLLDAATQIGISSLLAGINLTLGVRDWLLLGTGLAVAHVGATGWEEYAAAQAIVVPLRVEFAFPLNVKRTGILVSLMVAPGLSRLAHSTPRGGMVGNLGGAVVASVGVGYAWW